MSLASIVNSSLALEELDRRTERVAAVPNMALRLKTIELRLEGRQEFMQNVTSWIEGRTENRWSSVSMALWAKHLKERNKELDIPSVNGYMQPTPSVRVTAPD